MWKISRNLIFPRWAKNKQKYAENSSALPITVGSFQSAEKKRYSNQDGHKRKHFNQSERFWSCDNMRFLLFKTSALEKAGWLGTVTILCFNLHFKHFQLMHNYERGKSHCVFSRNVLAMPQNDEKQKTILQDSQNAEESSLLSSFHKPKNLQPTNEVNIFDDLRQISAQYANAVNNLSGLSHLKSNAKKAFHHFQEAARLGSSQGFYNLGLCYELGKGTKLNLTRAAFCYRKAAMKGHGLASFNLAIYFLKGMGGLPIDQEIANRLLAEAAKKDVPEAQLYIGLENLECEKWSEAFKIFETLAAKNVLDGKYYLALCYENGWGVNKDEKFATEIFSQAAIAGHSKSILRLIRCYEEGIGGCDPDLDFSTALCQILADKGDEEGRNTLLRLKEKRDFAVDMESFNKNLSTRNVGKIMQNSSSVPELSSVSQNSKYKNGLETLVAQSYLGLITSFPVVKTHPVASNKTAFYIGNEKSESNLTSVFMPHIQINMHQLMTAKS